MNKKSNKMFWIKFPYYVGIAADALWAVALFIPSIFALILSNPDFSPDLQSRLIMGIGGSLMTGWTLLLYWAVRKPIERRMVALLTAFPVIFGLFFVALFGFLDGNTSNIWILIKLIILFICMVMSYIFAGKIE